VARPLRVYSWQGHRAGAHPDAPWNGGTTEVIAAPSVAAVMRATGKTRANLFNLAPTVMRYDNSLPLILVRRIVGMLTNPDDLVVDGFAGSGTTPIACWEMGRRCIAGDLNPHAIGFAAARLLTEHVWPAERAPSLFEKAQA
jgi:hypothetical protein